jgi:hypothetical protein
MMSVNARSYPRRMAVPPHIAALLVAQPACLQPTARLFPRSSGGDCRPCAVFKRLLRASVLTMARSQTTRDEARFCGMLLPSSRPCVRNRHPPWPTRDVGRLHSRGVGVPSALDRKQYRSCCRRARSLWDRCASHLTADTPQSAAHGPLATVR